MIIPNILEWRLTGVIKTDEVKRFEIQSGYTDLRAGEVLKVYSLGKHLSGYR